MNLPGYALNVGKVFLMIYTKNEKKNTKLLKGDKVISALNEIEKITLHAKIYYPRQTIGYVFYSKRKNKYLVKQKLYKLSNY